MNSAVESMLEKYKCKNINDYKNALKEIIQEIVLLGFYKSDFFNIASFYGGSALRIFHKLNRFSEDLDFSLLKPDNNFKLTPYFSSIGNELAAYGFETEIIAKEKIVESNVESAFIKADTLINLLKITSINPPVLGVHKNEQLKIKFEVDMNPPLGANYETKYNLNPIPYSVKLYDLPSQFAGKLHSVLCRKWKTRIKGRDLFDYIWFLSNDISVNIYHLEERMKQSGHLKKNDVLDNKLLLEKLIDKFEVIDYKQAIDDVIRFIKNIEQFKLWSKEFFISITNEKLRALS
ncbi:MAG: nucleotidyl transferase AbiEii/AbiGii toxin family protein [Ignavibacteria bacterium]|jgi:hypothetical protein